MTPKARAQEALLPCPVCDGRMIWHEDYSKTMFPPTVYLKCEHGCLRTYDKTIIPDARECIAKSWNTRSTPSPAINQEPPTEKVLDAMCRAYISDWDDKLSFGEGGYQSGYTVDQMNWKKERMKKVYVAIQTTEALEKHAAAVKHSQEK